MSGYFWVNDVRYYQWKTGEVTLAEMQNVSRMTRRGEPQTVCASGTVSAGMPKTLAPEVKTVSHPYYIGSSVMVQDREQGRKEGDAPRWAKRTVAEAIKEAEKRLAEDPSKDYISIVKIVRVVRRSKPVVATEIEVVE